MEYRGSPLALECLHQLNRAGYEAFLVGGCVRDLLRGVIPHDYDICTSAFPEETCRIFQNDQVILTGLHHGTVTVLKEKHPFEITTFRTDGEYTDFRHPDRVTFTSSLKTDLSRRDFTMNAIAWNPQSGIYDPFNGQKAVREQKILTVGNPFTRFEEDALRMLRAIRFEACLGFSIERSVITAIEQKAEKIKFISRERIREEITKILLSKNPSKGIRRLLSLLGKELFGESVSSLMSCDILDHITASEPLRYAAFLMQTSAPLQILKGLRPSSELIRAVDTILQTIKNEYPLTPAGARFLCHDAGSLALDVAELIDALKGTNSKPSIYQLVKKTLEYREPVALSSLAITGEDLLRLGIPSGPEIGRILNALLSIVLESPENNNKEFLLQAATNLSAFT